MRLCASLLLVPLVLFGRMVFDLSDENLPWLTGPLLAPSSLVVPAGHYNVEPYIYSIANVGSYDSHWSAHSNAHVYLASSFQPSFQLGLASWLDFQMAPLVYYNRTQGVSAWAFGDFPIGFDFQLYHSPDDSWVPNIKFFAKESFPTGKYHHLDLHKKGTDAGGNGSYTTTVGIVCGKLFSFGGAHHMTLRFGAQWNLPTQVRVKGKNAFGGGEGTDGVYQPAQSVQGDIAFEYTWTRHWAVAIDLVGTWAADANFSGNPGLDDNFSPAQLGAKRFIQYSIAPAVEYNWNARWGLIAGSWFTVAGKNSVQFYSGLIALNYYH